MSHKLRLFYANGACSLAPHIALEEVGVSYDPVLVDTKGGEHKRPDYLRINPKARVPALAIDDWVLTENPAILQFIARSFPEAGLWPKTLQEQARVAECVAWIASTVHVAYAHVRHAERYATTDAALEDVRAKGLEASRDLWRAVDAALGDGPWAIGTPTRWPMPICSSSGRGGVARCSASTWRGTFRTGPPMQRAWPSDPPFSAPSKGKVSICLPTEPDAGGDQRSALVDGYDVRR